jgi:hypothetical protein
MKSLALLAFALHLVGRIPNLQIRRDRIFGLVKRHYDKPNEITTEISLLVPIISWIGGFGLLLLMFSPGFRTPLLGALVLILASLPRAGVVSHCLITVPLLVGIFVFRGDFV